MNYEQFFPLGIAKDPAFIGRCEEAQWLKSNLNAGVHSLLLAPRRYGKSSLILHVLEQLGVAYVEIDLQLCRSAKVVARKIIHGVEKVVSDAIPEKEKIISTATTYFKKSKKQWNIGIKGLLHVVIEPDEIDETADNILTALQFLESILEASNKKAVLFIDEMQEIVHVEQADEIQGAIRHFAQKSSAVVFVFSGSSRRLLRQMFNDKTKPLYQLCDNLGLDKIDPDEYTEYLNMVSSKTGHGQIASESIYKILNLSQRHPRRLYHLCLYVWRLADTSNAESIDIELVEKAWQKLVAAEAKAVRHYLSELNNSQLKVLVYISLHKGIELTGKEAIGLMNLSGGAIRKALTLLEDEDLIERNDNNVLEIIDPVVREVIVQYETEILS